MFLSCFGSKTPPSTCQKLPPQCFCHASCPRHHPRLDRNFRRNVFVMLRVQDTILDLTETSAAMFLSCFGSKTPFSTCQKLPPQCFCHASCPRHHPRLDRNFRRNVSVMLRIQDTTLDMSETSAAMFLS